LLRECFKARSRVTALNVSNNELVAYTTRHHGVKIFSSLECSVKKNISIELLSYQTTAVCISKDSKLLAFCNANNIYVFDLASKILLHTIRTTSKKIELISFTPDSTYLITGDSEGRVLQYRYDGKSKLSRLCSFGYSTSKLSCKAINRYVSCFAFYNEYIACSGYGGVITILKMNSHTNKFNIAASKVRINVLRFLDAQRLISANADGLLQIHSLKKYQQTKKIDTPFININEILLMPNRDFVLVSGESNKLILVNTKTAKVVSTNYLEFKEEIQTIALTHDNNLLVVLVDNQFLKVELPSVEDIKSHLLYSTIDEALIMIDNEPMLQGTREHKRVEVMYEKLYAQAINALVNADKREAKSIIEMFENVESKRDEIGTILRDFEYYPRFKILFLDKKYALAYAMAQKHPALTHTRQYKKMEEIFKETFTFAQKQILIGREDIAKEILSVYANVLSKKPILNLVLKQNREFIEFLQAIELKNYTLIEKLIKKNEIFTQIPTYKLLKQNQAKILQDTSESIIKGDLLKAKSLLKTVVSTPDTQEEIELLHKKCQLTEKLYNAYAKNDFTECYEIVDTKAEMDDLELSHLLENHWAKIMLECEVHALRGNIKGIKNLLGDLIHIESRIAKIGDLIRLSFHTKIKILLAKKNFNSAQSIIYSYIDIFSNDDEILLLMKTYERVSSRKLAITLDSSKNVSRDSWIKSSLIMH